MPRLVAAVAIQTAVLNSAAVAVQFEVSLDPPVATQPVSGRLYVFLSQRGGEPRFGPDWFHPEPFFRVDVIDWKQGAKCIVDDNAAGFPDRLSKLPPGDYRAQAVLANNIYSAEPGRGAGNLYSHVQRITVTTGAAATIALTLDQTIAEPKLPDVEWIKPVEIHSKLLSQFHHREIVDRAAIILPAGYSADETRRYPVLYVVPSFGGSYHDAWGMFRTAPQADPGQPEFIRVMLDGQCEWGHHVYADSATNGPRGESLIKEMIPEIDRRFRTVASPGARFLAGHSSGGWSSLWLQVAYPDFFGGVWSTSPDPVDFQDFQRIDLYANPPQNMYADAAGQRRPIARRGENPVQWFDTFTRMDDVLGRGGQLRSFEAAFSPLDSAGLPRRLWDRAKGRVDPEVAKAWEPYDIRLKLERNWATLGPKLKGKLHVTTGSLDTFYLDGAVVRLRDSLQKLGSDAEVTIVPGADHVTVLTPDYFRNSRRQMADSYRKSFPTP